MHTNGNKGGCFMSQEKVIKFLLLIVLLYNGMPVLSFSGELHQTIFTFVWMGFAGLLLLSLLMKKESVRIKAVKKRVYHQKQNTGKRLHLGS
jgi:Na+/H+ antiporter NhaC